MSKRALILCLLAAALPARAGVVVESWGPAGRFAHPKTLTVAEDGKRIAVDLSALPAGAKVHRARLVCFRDALPGDKEDALINVEIVPGVGAKPLELIGPWYDAFAVPASSVQGGKTISFEVRAFPGWIPQKTFLEVCYEGKPTAALPAAKGVKAFHSAGQTFITWEEIEKVVANDRPTWAKVKAALAEMDEKRAVRYRIYASVGPITASNLHQAALLGEVGPLSGYNILGRSADQAFHYMRKRMLVDMGYAKNVSRQWYAIPAAAHNEVVIDRLVIPSGKQPLANGTGLYVHTAAKGGKAYYAVTVVVDGRENTAALTQGVNVVGPVVEKPGAGMPVFQREMDMKIHFDYAGRRLQYIQWTAPPLSNLPNQYYNWSVFTPDGVKDAAPLEMVLSGNDMFRRPRWPHRLDTILVSPHDRHGGGRLADGPISTWYFGYHESAGTLRSMKQGAIQPYTWRRMLAFLDWAVAEFKADASRVTCSGDRGHSATAALHFGMRHPDVFSLVYTCKGMPTPAALPLSNKRYGRRQPTATAALQKLIGRVEWGLKTDTGRDVWKFLDLTAEVAANPKVVRPMLSYGGRGQWDWAPVAKFLGALADARQPVISEGTWGAVNPPGLKNPGRRVAGLDVRRDRPIPAFTNCTGDYQGGRNGGGGATNYGMWWEDASIVDEQGRFEVIITGGAAVDVTPRRTKNFVLRPGEKVRYKTELLGTRGRREDKPQSGEAVADANGLVTIRKVNTRGRAKLVITRSGS